jgi:proteasome lid subunit RPN8/RPN11
MDFYHLEDFQEQPEVNNMIDKKIKNFIKQQSLKNFPNEVCGFIVYNQNKFICIPCKNIAKDPDKYFEISSLEFLKIKKLYKKIYYIYHSHTNSNIEFSEMDKNCAKNLNLPMLLYNTTFNIFKKYDPTFIEYDLIGRFYEYKKYDCFTLVRDFYLKKLKADISIEYKENLKDLDIKNTFLNNIASKKLVMINDINSIKDNDILLLDGARKSSHFAVYLGEENILHQPMYSLSKIEKYSEFYKKRTNLIFRLQT